MDVLLLRMRIVWCNPCANLTAFMHAPRRHTCTPAGLPGPYSPAVQPGCCASSQQGCGCSTHTCTRASTNTDTDAGSQADMLEGWGRHRPCTRNSLLQTLLSGRVQAHTAVVVCAVGAAAVPDAQVGAGMSACLRPWPVTLCCAVVPLLVCAPPLLLLPAMPTTPDSQLITRWIAYLSATRIILSRCLPSSFGDSWRVAALVSPGGKNRFLQAAQQEPSTGRKQHSVCVVSAAQGRGLKGGSAVHQSDAVSGGAEVVSVLQPVANCAHSHPPGQPALDQEAVEGAASCRCLLHEVGLCRLFGNKHHRCCQLLWGWDAHTISRLVGFCTAGRLLRGDCLLVAGLEPRHGQGPSAAAACCCPAV